MDCFYRTRKMQRKENVSSAFAISDAEYMSRNNVYFIPMEPHIEIIEDNINNPEYNHPLPKASAVGESSQWTEEKVKLLLSSFEELCPKIGRSHKLGSKTKMWREITKRFVDRGYNYSVKQISNKYTSLERQYRKAKMYNNRTGTNRITCPFKNELERIFEIQNNAIETEIVQSPEDSFEDLTCSSPDSVLHDQEIQIENKSCEKKNLIVEQLELFRAQKADEARRARDMKEAYYREKLQILKKHIERKNAHMAKKEAVWNATLKKLQR